MNKKKLTYVVVIACVMVAFVNWFPKQNSETRNEPNPTTTTQLQSNTPQKLTPSTVKTAPAKQLTKLDQLKSWFSSDDPAWAWAQIDMKSVQAALPENLYWELAAPTDDALLIEQRLDQKQYWEKEYNKIRSGTAAIQEVQAYYKYRKQVSTDYLAFTDHLLTNYADALPEQDASLLKLTRELHSSRLEDIPKEQEQAVKRSEEHNKRKNEWLADKKAFEATLEAQVKKQRQVTTNQSD